MTTRPDRRRSDDLTARYLPVVAILVLLAVFVALAPSRVPLGAPAAAIGSLPAGGASIVTGPASDGAAPVTSEDGRAVVDPSSGSAGPGAGPRTGTATGAGSAVAPGQADCTRQMITRVPTCRPPWNGGDNGGATYPGVSDDVVQLVLHMTAATAQGQAIAAALDTATREDVEAILPGFLEFFNEHYETYGREVAVTIQEGPNTVSAADTSGDQANAAVAFQDNKAFAVIAASSTVTFHAEAARLRHPVVAIFAPWTNAQLDAWAPYAFVHNASADMILGGMADYYCNRLAGSVAEFGGDDVNQLDRKLGVMAPAGGSPDAPDFGALAARFLTECGHPPAKVINYDSDVTVAAQTATNAMVQMKAAGVTTVTCYCAGVALAFFTNAAENQGYHPEWFSSGFPNPVTLQRTANPNQWQHSFGLSSSSFPVHLADTDMWNAYYSVRPPGSDKESLVKAGSAVYRLLYYAFAGIESAGPLLTPESFAGGLLATPASGGDGPIETTGFGTSFQPAPPYSPWAAVRDLTETWWCASCTDPDGSPGTVFYVNGGARYRIGKFPTGRPNVFVDDRSPQPTPDPDR